MLHLGLIVSVQFTLNHLIGVPIEPDYTGIGGIFKEMQSLEINRDAPEELLLEPGFLA